MRHRFILLLLVVCLPVAHGQIPGDLHPSAPSPKELPQPTGEVYDPLEILSNPREALDPDEPVGDPLPTPPALPAPSKPDVAPARDQTGSHPERALLLWSPPSEAPSRPDVEVANEGPDAPHPATPAGPQAPVVALAGVGLVALVVWLLRRRLPEDRTRRRIVRLVRRDPGRHLTDLARELSLDRTTVRHHVDRLVEEGLVATRRTGRCRRVYPAEADEADDGDLADLLDHPVRSWIVRRLLRRRRLDQRRLRTECEVAPSTLTYHAKRLEEAGLVERRSRGRRTVLALVDAWRDRLRQHL